MPHKPIPTKKFIKYLRSLGLRKLRTEGDHEVWDNKQNPLSRPVIIVACEKEIPAFHIRTNLSTLGLTMDDLLEWLNK